MAEVRLSQSPGTGLIFTFYLLSPPLSTSTLLTLRTGVNIKEWNDIVPGPLTAQSMKYGLQQITCIENKADKISLDVYTFIFSKFTEQQLPQLAVF